MNWFVASIGVGIGVVSTLLALAAERRYGFPVTFGFWYILMPSVICFLVGYWLKGK